MVQSNKFLRVFIMTVAVLGGTLFSSADPLPGTDPIIFQVGWQNPTTGSGENPRSPIEPPQASIDDHTFYLNEVHAGFTLYLVDNSGEEPMVVYQVAIPANVYSVVLPATFIGTYELQLHNGGDYYFYSEIELE